MEKRIPGNKQKMIYPELSIRLQAVAALAETAEAAADIGTDHAYVPIRLVQQGTMQRAVAMDINPGPLQRAADNIKAAGLEGKIETRLSDGLKGLEAGEVSCIIIAGMGGPLMIRILEQSMQVAKSAKSLILQPQSDIRQVREWLQVHFFTIEKEDLAAEDGKYYPMMRVCPGGISRQMDEAELRFGPDLLRQAHPVLEEFLYRELRICENIAEELRKHDSERTRLRREQVEDDIRWIRSALVRTGEKVKKDDENNYN